MPTPQEQYDDAMFDFSQAEYDSAIAKLSALLSTAPDHFEAQLALGMAHYRKGDYATAIAEGHKAEKLKPHEQLVHTNLSLFYMKSGDKKTAEHHGLQARIASWKENMARVSGVRTRFGNWARCCRGTYWLSNASTASLRTWAMSSRNRGLPERSVRITTILLK